MGLLHTALQSLHQLCSVAAPQAPAWLPIPITALLSQNPINKFAFLSAYDTTCLKMKRKMKARLKAYIRVKDIHCMAVHIKSEDVAARQTLAARRCARCWGTYVTVGLHSRSTIKVA